MKNRMSASAGSATRRVVVWGTYDLGKPRTRIMLAALRAAGFEVIEIHAAVWSGVEDKSQLAGPWRKIRFALRWLAAYPSLLWHYLRAPRHDATIVAYLGHFDVLLLWPLAKLHGCPVIWDAFLSLHDTIVSDRRLIGPRHPLARLVHVWEWLACRAADRVVLDTAAHVALFDRQYHLADDCVTAIMVGAEAAAFAPVPLLPAKARDGSSDGGLKILFYGQFIPLHGIETIVAAAQRARGRPHRWILVGRGQESARISALIAEGPPARIERHDWVPYEELGRHIAEADICLGIFGATGKAGRVIPNKVFQILTAGRPLITRRSPAILELLDGTEPGIRLVPPADPDALLAAVEALGRTLPKAPDTGAPLHGPIVARFSEAALARRWREVVEETLARRH
jgi:glycosyltransferase involved in cell wall biosynthesis